MNRDAYGGLVHWSYGMGKKGLAKVAVTIINGNITPRDIEKKSHKYFWFKCDVCPHDFKETIYNITFKNKWCGYCSGKKLCDDDDCDFCYNNSFASLGE